MNGALVIFAIVAISFFAYFVSLLINPYAKCTRCHGKPRKQGMFFGYAHRVCPRCDGTGQELRLGRKLFKMDRPNAK